MERRQLLRAAGVGSLAAVAAPVLTGGAAAASANGLSDAGAGIYTDMSVASQLSTYSIQQGMVTCGVGTVGTVLGGGLTGPFSMVMYSVGGLRYNVDRASRMIKATGRMVSITMVAGLVHENVEHDFIAIATDHRGVKHDRFDVHFVTPFWSPSNPMATVSDQVVGWVRFGGNTIRDLNGNQMGGVTVD